MQGTTHLNLNSGLFYIQANVRTIDLMKRIAARLAREKAWDQVRLLKLAQQSFWYCSIHHTIFIPLILAASIGAQHIHFLQSVFNEEIFFLSHGNYKNPGVTVRVMDIYMFMNSKVIKSFRATDPVHWSL